MAHKEVEEKETPKDEAKVHSGKFLAIAAALKKHSAEKGSAKHHEAKKHEKKHGEKKISGKK